MAQEIAAAPATHKALQRLTMTALMGLEE